MSEKGRKCSDGKAAERRPARAAAGEGNAKLTAEELAELYVFGDWDVHGATLEVWHTRRADALAQGLRLARSLSKRRRESACWLIAVGGTSSREADAALARLAADRYEGVAESAIGGPNILQVRRSSAVHGPRMQANRADTHFPWMEPIPAFVDLRVLANAARHPDGGVRLMVAFALQLCGEPEATRILHELALDEDNVVRASALGSMGWKRYAGGVTPEVIEALWAATGDPSMEIRASAARSLVELEEPGAKENFIRELEKAIEANASHLAIHPMAVLLYSDLSDFLPADLRQEACRRWAKPLVGKPAPSIPASKSSQTAD